MRETCRRLAIFIAVLAAIPPGPVLAGQTIAAHPALPGARNAEERINFSGKLRMLSQRIPSAACHLARGIDPDGARMLLRAAPAEFEKILTALEFGGDADLNIRHPETRRQTIVRIHALRREWEPLRVAAHAVAEGTGTRQDVDFILTQNIAVLQAAIHLVPELVRQYSAPDAVPFADLLLIDISGRQRMLTQKMSKESCMLGTDHMTPATRDDLEGTMQTFEASLNALRDGLPELGLRPPPNDTIAAGLEVVFSDWSRVKPLLDEIRAGEVLDDPEEIRKFQELNTTMANMNEVVGMYTLAAKPSS